MHGGGSRSIEEALGSMEKRKETGSVLSGTTVGLVQLSRTQEGGTDQKWARQRGLTETWGSRQNRGTKSGKKEKKASQR